MHGVKMDGYVSQLDHIKKNLNELLQLRDKLRQNKRYLREEFINLVRVEDSVLREVAHYMFTEDPYFIDFTRIERIILREMFNNNGVIEKQLNIAEKYGLTKVSVMRCAENLKRKGIILKERFGNIVVCAMSPEYLKKIRDIVFKENVKL